MLRNKMYSKKPPMFRRLKNRFLILSMCITSLVMTASFAAIYLTTYSNIQNVNVEKLHNISLPVSNAGGLISFGEGEDAALDNKVVHMVSQNATQSFSILTDSEKNIIQVSSLFDIPYSDYEKAVRDVYQNTASNTITIGGKLFIYEISAPEISTVKYTRNSGYSMETETLAPDNYIISFLDITDSRHTLQDLLITFFIVGTATLAVIFFVCLYFAERMISPVEESWEKQMQFIADASHELKTPLAIISSNIGALKANKEETVESQIKWLNYISSGTDRMSKLVNQLLSLARLDIMAEDISVSQFNLSELADDIISSMYLRISEKNISLISDVDPNITIKSNEERIRYILTILLDNAIKYTNNSGSIIISIKPTGKTVRCSVKNTGEGISKENLPKIFDRFYRSDKSRTSETEGYGLGLSIAKSYADSLKTTIQVKSTETKETEFWFELEG